MNFKNGEIKKFKKLIKKRLLNTKNNRIYIQDSELRQTIFIPGEKYNFKFNKKNGTTLKIFIDEKGKHKISKRKRNEHINPVIDIRTKDILKKFSEFEKLQIEIYENEILVRGLNSATQTINKRNKILDFKENKIKKSKNEILIAKNDINNLYLKQVVNDRKYRQITFEDIIETNFSEINISTKYKNEDIDNYNKDINTAIRFVSLFSGAGILDKGFIDEGFKSELAIELEKDMVDTYSYNLGSHIVQADISKYDIESIPDAEILIGGSPCQDLSNENRRTGKNVLESPKNLLIRKYIEVAKHMKSLKVFVLENVPQLITKGKQFVKEIKENFSDFEVTVNKINSVDYGSAQNRERTIIIGSKIGKIELKKPVIKLYKTVRQAFHGLTDKVNNQLDYSKSRKETLLKMSFVKPGRNFKDIPKEYRGKGSHSNLFRRLEWDKPSITIANPRKSNILHPEKDRILSVRECARLFDVPDSFKFLGGLSSKQQMICNAVPLKVAKAIAENIKEMFIKNTKSIDMNILREV